MRKHQRGLSLAGLSVTSVAVILIALVAIKVVPPVLEYRLVRQVVTKTARDANEDKVVSEGQVRNIFSRHLQVESIYNINEDDVKMRRTGDGIVVSLSYSRKLPLLMNASLLLEFKTESTGRGRF